MNRGNKTSGNLRAENEGIATWFKNVDRGAWWRGAGKLSHTPSTGSHPERGGWTHQRAVAAVPSGSPSHSFSSDCSRYSSAQRAGDTDKGSARSREVGISVRDQERENINLTKSKQNPSETTGQKKILLNFQHPTCSQGA